MCNLNLLETMVFIISHIIAGWFLLVLVLCIAGVVCVCIMAGIEAWQQKTT